VRYVNSELEIIDPATPLIGKWRQFRDIDYYFFSTKCGLITTNLHRGWAAEKGKFLGVKAQERRASGAAPPPG
jgi:hypothetical protein